MSDINNVNEPAPNYDFDDYRAAFLAALEASIQRKGIFMVDEGSFQSLVTNAGGVAQAAARQLARERQRHAAKALETLKEAIKAKPVKVTGSGNP